MVNLDWAIIGGVSLGIICFCLFVFSLIKGLIETSHLNKLNNQTTDSKTKRNKLRKKMKTISNIKTGHFKRGILFFVLTIVFSVISGYAIYYQKTTMTTEDTDNIVTSYYLIDQISTQLEMLESDASADKVKRSIHELAIRLASFSAKRANDQGSEESQLLLNKYYKGIGQLGVNLAADSFEEEFETYQGYLEDIKKARVSQKKVIDYYKINEESLKQKK